MNEDIQQEVYLHIPNLSYDELPSILEKEDTFWDINRLFICLLYANDVCFVNGVLLIAEKRPSDLKLVFTCIGCILWQLETWLHPSVNATFIIAIDKLASCNSLNVTSLMEEVKIFENSFQHWRERKFTNIVDLIDAILPDPKFRHRKISEHFNKGQCVELLIDWDVDILSRLHQNHTALYHAVAHNHYPVILKLLQKGSFIGSAINFFNQKIGCNDKKVLEQHFDNCITKCVADDRFIEIDFKNLLYPPNDTDEPCEICADEMKAIQLIGECNEYKYLLTHPLIATFVLLKWNQLAFLFHVHFMLYLLFVTFTIGYIICITNDVIGYTKNVFAIGSISMTIYLAIRRISHQIYESFYREQSFHDQIYNYLNTTHTAITVILVALVFLNNSPYYHPIWSTLCVIAMSGRLFILSGSLFWSFSKYYIMFLNVAWSSLRSLQLCIILLPTFAFSFYLLLRSQSLEAMTENQLDKKEISLLFSSLRSTVIKTIAMIAGEFENGEANFDATNVSTCLYLAFVFLITIVFMNLMNGLAVRDIQEIQIDAEATSMRQRVQLLAHFEVMVSKKHHRRRKFHYSFIEKMFKFFAKINTLESAGIRLPVNTKIYIGQHNEIFVLQKDYKTTEQDSVEFSKNGSYLYSWTSFIFCSQRYLRVNSDTMKVARHIIEMKVIEHREQCEKKQLKNQINKLKLNLTEIMKIVKRNNNKNF